MSVLTPPFTQENLLSSSSSAQALLLAISVPILENRWTQLALSLICMMAISSPQYVWALLTKPMVAEFGVNLSQLQVTFSLLIVFQTFLSPFQGYLIDRFGPRLLLSIGGALTDTFGKKHATTNHGFLYMAQGIGSILGGPLAAWMHESTGS